MQIRFILICCLLALRVAANDGLPLTYLGIEQGLSNNTVRSIFQDSKGFMWFGTFDGLNRYDGYSFKVFRNTFNDSNSLVNNFVHAVNEDAGGNIWAGTNKGLSIYAAATEQFSLLKYRPHGANATRPLTTEIKDIQRSADGTMLVSSLIDGLIIALPGGTAWQVPLVVHDTIYTQYAAGTIRIDAQKRVWVFVISIGLCRYDPDTRQLKLVNDQLKAAFHFLPDGESLWVGTNNGIYSYNTRTNTYARALNTYDPELATDKVAGFAIDRQHRLWMVTKGNGVKFFDPATRQVTHLIADGRLNSISNENFNAVLEDREGRIWLGSQRGGINVIDRQKDRFATIAHDPLNTNSLVNNYVFAFYEMEDGRIWVGSEFGGISLWDRRNNQFTNFKYNPHNTAGISNNFITSIQQDHEGDVWIATYWGGINRYNRSNNTFTRYKCLNPAYNNQENKMGYQLLVDKSGTLWATTLQEGGMKGALYRYNKQQDRFEAFDTRLSELFALKEDSKGRLWSGNLSQLIRIDHINKQHQYYNIGNTIRSIVEDSVGHLWIGTEGGGLVLFDPAGGQIMTRYTTAEGLCNNTVLNILPDRQGNLWMSTSNGVSRFHIATGAFRNYYQGDGLQSNQFNPNAGLALRSGELMFGGIKGFNIFHPEKILSTAKPVQVFLTGITVDGLPVPATTHIKVPYNKAVFAFQYVVPEYSTPDKINYAYYMEGWDRGWNQAGNQRSASYTHLSEGNYTFRVKNTNTDGVWNPQEVTLHITVLPPWYRTWFAWLLYVGAAVTLVYTWWRYRNRQIRLKYEVAIAHLDAENKRSELERERAEREKEQVLNERERTINEKKLNFFTNISHEFRTPLTLIINPLKDLLGRKQEEQAPPDGELHTVYRNARRMLSLVDQLLLFRKAESGMDKIRPARQDVCTLAKEVYLCFVQQAKTRKMSYNFDYQCEQPELYADREKLEIILYNLLSNAIKYTPEGGSITLQISETPSEVIFRVQDNGIGINKEAGEQLFEKFYRASGKAITAQQGFGIGLYLVKHFTAQHKGHIAWESKEGEGTTFILSLLKGTQHFDPEVILEQAPASPMLLEELAPDDMPERQEEDITTGNGEPLEAIVSEKKAILLIDDDDQILQYLSGLFRNTYQVFQASDGEDGLKLARKHLPDLVISDVQMQGMNGIELCRHIKEEEALQHIPVILLTASTATDVRLKGVEGGADDYITKPFDKDILVARVASLLKARTILQHYFYNAITLRSTDQKVSREYKEFLERCIAIVESHLEDDQFNQHILLAEIGMSRSNLFRKVKSVSGLSIRSFIRLIRLRKAAELFIHTNYNVNETAFRVGINDIKFFRAEFNKVFGMNPSEYIKKYRKAFGDQYQVNLKEKPGK
jgi:signal transduction histidine kinase/ligand-binding sensor domain-containing protein/DNA-binding response OmpR family regulator